VGLGADWAAAHEAQLKSVMTAQHDLFRIEQPTTICFTALARDGNLK
jgi:hypothetical protein